MADPDEGFCDVIPSWHINRGTFDNTILDDLNVVAFFHAPGNMLTGPKWKVAMYIDQRATAEQLDAITRIYSGQSGGFFEAAKNLFGEVLGIKQSTIERGVEGRRRWLRINDSLELDIEGIKGADQSREALIINPAFSAVPDSDLWSHTQLKTSTTILDSNGIIQGRTAFTANSSIHHLSPSNFAVDWLTQGVLMDQINECED